MTHLSFPDKQGLEKHSRTDELVRLFQLAEEKIKLVENLNQELSIPAINELRYAGYHMTQYLSGQVEADAQLSKAENHCKRAIYDAVEAGITHQLELIKLFQHDFRNLIITETISRYGEIKKEVKAARDLILTPRDNSKDRSEYYAECSSHLENLRRAHDELEFYRDDLLKRLQKTNRDVWMYRATLAMLLICSGAFIYSALQYHHPQTPTVASAISPTVQLESAD
ncbi:hypothetical protein [Pseudomonas viridiflava]|uniref:hypothetical protein n=1 Tax=Pseudomonas viridiflava TaxID=33069 RepID=UPI000F015D8C|nr:hypothetical protein [Pseudomonas viridiflava]